VAATRTEDGHRLPKQALQYKPKWRRNIGWPKKRWRDQLHFEDQGTGNTPNPSWTWWWWWSNGYLFFFRRISRYPLQNFCIACRTFRVGILSRKPIFVSDWNVFLNKPNTFSPSLGWEKVGILLKIF
jgi:hypothetical protein